MIARAIEDVVDNFERMIEISVDFSEELIITRLGKATVVLMSEADLKSIYEIIGTDVAGIGSSVDIEGKTIVELTDAFDQMQSEADSVKLAITRPGKETVIMMTEVEYNNLVETEYLFRNPDRREKIMSGIEQLEQAEDSIRKLIDENE